MYKNSTTELVPAEELLHTRRDRSRFAGPMGRSPVVGEVCLKRFFEKSVTLNVRAFGGFHRSVLCYTRIKGIVPYTRTLKILFIDSIYIVHMYYK
jgi:hypothetical protein